MSTPRFALYAVKDCPECPPVQDLLDDMGVLYDFFWVMPSPDPKLVEIWTKDNQKIAQADRSQLPASPALYDRRLNFVFCGQTLIRRHIKTVGAQPWA